MFPRVSQAQNHTDRSRREWSRRESRDIDEARKGELSGESESIEAQTYARPRESQTRGIILIVPGVNRTHTFSGGALTVHCSSHSFVGILCSGSPVVRSTISPMVFFAVCSRARALRSHCQHHRKRESQHRVSGCKIWHSWSRGVSSYSHLCQNRDPIANLGNLHGGPIRHNTDFNTHFDPLIFIVPVGLDGVDIDRELPRRGLYAYGLGSY